MTRYFKTDALVLRSFPFKEADRLVTFLTWEKGKIDAIVRGARKTRSKLAAGVELFTYGHYLFYRGRSLATLTHQEVKETFSTLPQSLEAYGLALYFAELIYRLLEKEEPAKSFCCLLLAAWRILQDEESQIDRELLRRSFELKLLSLLGYSPALVRCSACNSTTRGNRFNISQGGIVCYKCSSGQGLLPFSPGTAALATFLLNSDFEKLTKLRPLGLQKKELAAVADAFLRYHGGVSEFRSARFLAQLSLLPRNCSSSPSLV